MDLVDMAANEMIEEVTNSIVNDFNDFLVQCFRKCGFSIEQILSNPGQFSIESCQGGLNDYYNTYKFCDKPLFSIHQYIDYESYRIIGKCSVIFHEEKNRPSVLTNAGEIKLEERTVI